MPLGRVGPITREARLYGLYELCRRAGLSTVDLANDWDIEVQADTVQLRLRGTARLIAFPAAGQELSWNICAKKSWGDLAPDSSGEQLRDFVVPYSERDSTAGEPLFFERAPGHFQCSGDLLAATVLVLSRYEEFQVSGRDPLGRFSASQSMAVRDGYLDRPIVDEYGLVLQQVIQIIAPGWHPPERKLRIKVSHDIDQLGIPLSLRSTAGHFLKRRAIGLGVRDLLSLAGGLPGYLAEVRATCKECANRGLRSALYWKTSRPGKYDTGYDIQDARIVRVITWAKSRGVEMGFHPGFDTFLSPELLETELGELRKVLGGGRIGGRQHYLRWSPETWSHWEACGLSYDSTVGYADRVGFRAGTCWPYLPWLWKANRCASLLEIPLLVMDATLVDGDYMGKTPQESVVVVRDLLGKCRQVGGVFTILWHNSSLVAPFAEYFPEIFAELRGITDYDWESDLQTLQQYRSNLQGV